MQTAVKLNVLIPANHRVVLDLPEELPIGVAEIIVLVEPSDRPARNAEATEVDAFAYFSRLDRWKAPAGVDSVDWLREDRER